MILSYFMTFVTACQPSQKKQLDQLSQQWNQTIKQQPLTGAFISQHLYTDSITVSITTQDLDSLKHSVMSLVKQCERIIPKRLNKQELLHYQGLSSKIGTLQNHLLIHPIYQYEATFYDPISHIKSSIDESPRLNSLTKNYRFAEQYFRPSEIGQATKALEQGKIVYTWLQKLEDTSTNKDSTKLGLIRQAKLATKTFIAIANNRIMELKKPLEGKPD